MTQFALGFILFFSFLSLPVSAATIDFKIINGVFKSIAQEVIKLEQVQDKDGKDLIDGLEFSIDDKTIDLTKGKIDGKAAVKVNSSAWDKGKPSSVELLLHTEVAEQKSGDVLHLDTQLDLKTELLALIKHVIKETDSEKHFCSEENLKNSNAALEDFNNDVCKEFKKISSTSSISDFLDIIENVLDLRLAFINDELLPAAGNAYETKSLNQEHTYLKKTYELIHGRKDKNSVELSIVDDFSLFAETEITTLSIKLAADALSLKIKIVSPEGATTYKSFSQEIESLAEKFSLPNTDPEKKELIDSFKTTLRDLTKLAKTIVLLK